MLAAPQLATTATKQPIAACVATGDTAAVTIPAIATMLIDQNAPYWWITLSRRNMFAATQQEVVIGMTIHPQTPTAMLHNVKTSFEASASDLLSPSDYPP